MATLSDIILTIKTKYRNESIDGMHFSVLKSALQKYIRRSIENKALWSACRMDCFIMVITENVFEQILYTD